MELFIIVALLCLAVAVQPFATKRLPPVVHGVFGTLCVGISMAITALVASGLVAFPAGISATSQARAALPDIDRPAPPQKAESVSPSSAQSNSVPDDEGRFFELPKETESADIHINPSVSGVIIPEGRPAWVEAPPVREGTVHSTSVCSDPYSTPSHAMHALDEKLKAATAEYIAEYLHSDLAPSLIRYNVSEIKQKLLSPQNVYEEEITVSIGKMHQVHAKLEFPADFREQLDRRWAELRATYRLAETGLISGGVLLLLATVFGYFRLDNATRGYYTGRLQFMAAAAILAIVASGAMFSRWIHWL
jgi:hypothetical protein